MSQDWPDLSNHIVIAIESLELKESFQQDVAMQSIFVMYNFLPHFCQSAQEQCTQALPTGPDIIHYNHVAVSPSPFVVLCTCMFDRGCLYCVLQYKSCTITLRKLR